MHKVPFTEILRFIELIRECFPDAREVCTKGSCIRFALVLKHQYPSGNIYYNGHHAIFEYDNKFYDINGLTKKDGHIPLIKYGIVMLDKLLNLSYGKQ